MKKICALAIVGGLICGVFAGLSNVQAQGTIDFGVLTGLSQNSGSANVCLKSPSRLQGIISSLVAEVSELKKRCSACLRLQQLINILNNLQSSYGSGQRYFLMGGGGQCVGDW